MNKLLGGCMLGVGILVAGLSGLCSLLLLIEDLTRGYSAPDLGGLTTVLVVGGVPFLGGIGLVFLGRYLIRQDGAPPNPSRPPEPPETESGA